jgi:hypothetical protein
MAQLKHFSEADGTLLLSQEDAWMILRFFLDGEVTLAPGALTENDRSFAQALLIEAIDASNAMSWVEALFRSAMKPNATVKSIIRSLVKKALKEWFRAKVGSDPTIYVAVKNSLKRNWRSAWRIREATDEPVY